VYLGLSAVDHACRPNANVVFRGRRAELRAMEPLPDFASCRISYIHEMLPTADRQQRLEEQYYFLCDCRLCAEVGGEGACGELAAGRLRCAGCHAAVSLRSGSRECKQCGRKIADTAVKQYEEMVDKVKQSHTEPGDILRLWEQCDKIAHPWDAVRLQLAELAMKATLDRGEVARFYAIGQTVRNNYQAFFHPNSLSLGLYWAKMAKAAFFEGDTEAGGKFLRKALAVASLTYGENHPYFRYLLNIGPVS